MLRNICCAFQMPAMLLACLILISLSHAIPNPTDNSIFYYAFGSNMLAKRIHMQNPNAVSIGAAALKNYRLDFDQLNTKWRGARATILPAENSKMFGVLWKITYDEVENLDRQEGVPSGIYAAMNVNVKLLYNNTEVTARTYYLVDGVPENSQYDRRPSKTYLQCIVKGAQEANLPIDYIRYLQAIEHNGKISTVFEEELELRNVELIDT